MRQTVRHRPLARADASHPHATTASRLTCGKADVLARQTGIHPPENASIQRAGWGTLDLPHVGGRAAKFGYRPVRRRPSIRSNGPRSLPASAPASSTDPARSPAPGAAAPAIGGAERSQRAGLALPTPPTTVARCDTAVALPRPASRRPAALRPGQPNHGSHDRRS